MPASPFAFTPEEQVAIDRITGEFPDAARAMDAGLRSVVDDLIRSCQGLVATEAGADDVLGDLVGRIVDQTLAETEAWGDAEDIRQPVIQLLTRHLLANARDDFVRGLLAPKRN